MDEKKALNQIAESSVWFTDGAASAEEYVDILCGALCVLSADSLLRVAKALSEAISYEA